MRVTSFALIYVAVVFCFFMAGYSARPSLIQPAIQESQRVNAYPAWGVVSVGSGDVFEWNL